MLNKLIAALVLCFVIFALILSAVRGAEVRKGQAMQGKAMQGKAMQGKASWYGANDKTDPFPHIVTASGELFNENGFTCAMRSRNFGLYYKVTNLANGKNVVVRHNDFGPAARLNRLIDLSKAAFAAIADLDEGVITVSVEGI